MNYFFTSDTHFFHNNVIQYCNRPFSSAEEMNEALIDNWNETVGKEDLVFHTGDLAFKCGSRSDEIRNIFNSRLNGKIMVVRGNHDKKKHLEQWDLLWVEEVYMRLDGFMLWLNHFPLNLHDERYDLQRPKARLKFDLAIHGHRHSSPDKRETRDNWGKLIGLDVGVDAWNYHPVAWEQIKQCI